MCSTVHLLTIGREGDKMIRARIRLFAVVFALCLVLVLGGLLIWLSTQGADPYDLRHISINQVAEVTIFPPYYGDPEASLNDEEIQRLLVYLNRVNLFGKGDDDFRNWDGGYDSRFRITRTDGTEFTFVASPPFYILDSELGYNTFDTEFGYTQEDTDLCGEIDEFRQELNIKYYGRPR